MAEFLPLDQQRQAESEVWLAFTARSLVDPALRTLRDEAYDQLHEVCRGVVADLMAGTEFSDDRVAMETERLYALIDGLLLHRVIRPDRADAALLREVLTRHLDQLH